ncbi:MAG: alpha,alpha-trehalose-phosphate synthase (UDP-forming) [Burkholderiaceae bacterium]
MSRLLVVSNRVGNPKAGASAGGLAVGLGEAMREHGGVWFGWSGEVIDDGTPAMHHEELGNIELITTDLTRDEYETYYLGFSNQVLWPVFHYRVDLAQFESAHLKGYQRVNRRFAERLREIIRPDDVIWVHDFHLIPLAAELRAMGVANPIGFFLHIPFPPTQVLLTVPQSTWLIRSLFSYDLVGFQTEVDRKHFRRYVTEEAKGRDIGDNMLVAYGRTLLARAFPIGVDAEPFRALTHSRQALELVERQRSRNLGRTSIIGVDRLDYSKGLPQRMRAFERLLESYPENRGQVVFSQVAPPTRVDVDAYTDIRSQLEGLSGAINGRFSDFDWTPIRYIHRALARRTLAALYATSGVGLVTPLRDGMNLVAKEYVVAQDASNPGVLVLSRFAGAAETMTEALIVNPYDLDEVAEAMQTALRMPLDERCERHRKLLGKVMMFDNRHWARSFLEALRGAVGQIVTVV